MVAVGALPLGRVAAEVQWPILALLLGMLLLAACLEVAGLFDWLAGHVVRAAHSQAQLLAGSMVVVALLSALTLNDAVVLLFTPVLVKAARRMQVDAMPYLAGEAIAANVGSVATPVGNPQNAFIAVTADIPFRTFVGALLPVALVALALAILGVWLGFHRTLAKPLDPAAKFSQGSPPPADPVLLRAGLGVLALTFVGFLVARSLGLTLVHVAFAGGVAAVAVAAALRGRGAWKVVRTADYSVLVLFVGLFWLIGGFRASGWSEAMADALLGAGPPSLPGLALWSSLLSNVVSNVPAVLLIAPALAGASLQAWLVLAATSTLAGNATLLGAAANVLVAESARARGAHFGVVRFTLVGAPVAAATLLAALALLGALPR